MTAQEAFNELQKHHKELPARLLDALAAMAREIEQLKQQVKK